MMRHGAFNEMGFRNNVDKALKDVQRILDTTRNPRLIGENDNHVYDDKFLLAESLTHTSLAALQTSLTKLGITPDIWQQMITWCQVDKQVVTMRWTASDSCSLLKEHVVEVADPTEVVTKTTTTTGGATSWTGNRATTSTTKVVRKIKEHHWQIRVNLTLQVFYGTAVDQAVTIISRESSTICVTSGGLQTAKSVAANPGAAPIPPSTQHKPMDVDLTWFLQQWKVEAGGDGPATSLCQFAIDRTAATCQTPRRNQDVNQSILFHAHLETWGQQVGRFLQARLVTLILGQHKPVHRDTSLAAGTVCQLQNITKEPKFNGKTVVVREYIPSQDRYRVEPLDLTEGLPTSLLVKAKDLHADASAGNASDLNTVISIGEDIFTPVQPILEDSKILPDVEKLLEHHGKDLDRAVQHLARLYPSRQVTKILSLFEATTMLVCFHAPLVCRHYIDSVQFLEELLYQQVVQAIGKVVTPSDFGHFMRRHTRKLMGPNYAPSPFSYAVRRPNHAPDGMLTIEAAGGELIDSMVRHVPPEAHPPLQLPLSAATTVPITGDWYLHGWLMHQFSGSSSPRSFHIGARARQFSSFILVIGTMSGPAQLDPQHAILLQNKDDLMIPLLTQVLPSAQDFKDAIHSLSPEQQEFCKAFRSMQLESSVLGVCVIQLKPQLEKLLELTPGSLTKEMQLTQDLMSIFIEYQIPSDLVAFEGPTDSTKKVRLDAVKEHVQAVLKVMEAEKEKQLLEEEKKAELREAQAAATMYALDSEMEECEALSFTVQPKAKRAMHKKKGSRMAPPPAPQSFGAQAFSAQAPPPLAVGGAAQNTVTVASKPSADFQAHKGDGPAVTGSSAEDFTMLPKELDAKLDKLDTDNALRSTILKAGDSWTLKHQETLLSVPVTKNLSGDDISTAKKKAFDLLDALSRSGSLPIDAAELHVIVALSHCFEKDLMGTLIQDNVNPIAKAEKSALLLASTLYRKSPAELLAAEQDTERLTAAFPLLFEN